jgi:hypothetical protein
MSWLMRLFSATMKATSFSTNRRPTTFLLTCSSTSTIEASGLPRRSTPETRASTMSP